eukprot:2148249-Rhodomonas_salina.2
MTSSPTRSQTSLGSARGRGRVRATLTRALLWHLHGTSESQRTAKTRRGAADGDGSLLRASRGVRRGAEAEQRRAMLGLQRRGGESSPVKARANGQLLREGGLHLLFLLAERRCKLLLRHLHAQSHTPPFSLFPSWHFTGSSELEPDVLALRWMFTAQSHTSLAPNVESVVRVCGFAAAFGLDLDCGDAVKELILVSTILPSHPPRSAPKPAPRAEHSFQRTNTPPSKHIVPSAEPSLSTQIPDLVSR